MLREKYSALCFHFFSFNKIKNKKQTKKYIRTWKDQLPINDSSNK